MLSEADYLDLWLELNLLDQSSKLKRLVSEDLEDLVFI